MVFSGSRALSEAFQIFGSRFGQMLAVAAIFIVMIVAIFAAFGTSLVVLFSGGMAASESLGAGTIAGIFLLYLVFYLIEFAAQAALCRLCSDRHEPSIGDAIGAGLRSAPTLLGVAVIIIVGLVALSLVLGLLTAGLAMASNSMALSVLVPLLVLVAFAFVGIRLSMILPVVAIEEERNPLTALARSWRMTAGHAFKLFLVFAFAIAAIGVLMVILLFVTIGIPGPGNIPSMSGMISFGVAMIVLAVTIGNYFIALVAAAFRQLSGPSSEAIGETFA